jgi:hypothetical protein
MNSSFVRASLVAALALLSACGGVAPPSVVGAPASARIEEAQPSGGSAQVTTPSTVSGPPCATPCTISMLSGMQLWNVARPGGDQRVLLASVEPGAWRYQLRYRNRPLYVTGLVFNIVGLTASATATILLTVRGGAIPVIGSASTAILFLSLGLGFTVGAGSDVAVRVAPDGALAQRATRPQWAIAPMVDPTLVGASYALRF